MPTNDNLPADIADAMAYLTTGGLGEVIGFTDLAYQSKQAKVQCDTDMMVAILLLAAESIDKRPEAPT